MNPYKQSQFENLFNLEESQKENLLISGSNASGKTRLCCAFASMLHGLGSQVIVYDVSGTWKRFSNLPYISKPFRIGSRLFIRDLKDSSGIYDISPLRLSEAKAFCEKQALRIWNKQIDRENPRMLYLIFEESEIYLRYVRNSENLNRLLHVGRNINVRCILITTDLALLDPSVIRLCSIRFHGKLNIEENAKRKFRSYYGKDYQRIASEGLETGVFIRLSQGKLDIVKVPLFMTHKQPIALTPFLSQSQNQFERR